MSFSVESFKPQELRAAQNAAFDAATLVEPVLKENFGATDFATKSSERDWVTQWDGWAEERIRESLAKFSKDIGFMGEESGLDIAQDVYWAVDPIDGTSHFVRGNEICTTMISLVDHGVPVASVVYDFVHGVSYTAASGQGAYKDLNQKMSVSTRPIGTAYLEVYTDENTNEGSSIIKNIEATGAYLLRNASTGYTMTCVARGSTEGFMSLKNPYATVWDLAPGALLIHEAGGVVRNIGQEGFNLNNFDFIAANHPTFNVLEKLATGSTASQSS